MPQKHFDIKLFLSKYLKYPVCENVICHVPPGIQILLQRH